MNQEKLLKIINVLCREMRMYSMAYQSSQTMPDLNQLRRQFNCLAKWAEFGIRKLQIEEYTGGTDFYKKLCGLDKTEKTA